MAPERAFWRESLAPYAGPHLGRSLLDVATSVVPFLALAVLMVLALDVSYLLTLALAIPASGFLVRTYIVFHDCTHGSFLPSSGRTRGSARRSACCCSRRSPRGATTTPCTTRPPATSTAAA